MDQVIPWQRWLAIVEPYYPKAGNGRPPMPLSVMLRIYCLQQWYALSDPGGEEALYDIECMRTFACIELGEDPIPDETTILKFRRLIETHQLSQQLFADVNDYLAEQGIKVSQGSMVDASIIHSPSSIKNKEKQRDQEMKSTRKGSQYYFGMKVHIGTDVNSNVIHSATVTSANEAAKAATFWFNASFAPAKAATSWFNASFSPASFECVSPACLCFSFRSFRCFAMACALARAASASFFFCA